VRGVLLALAYNFFWASLIGFGLARVFLHDLLQALGFLLVMVVPCSSMSIAYTGLAKGDVERSTVIVGSSFVVGVPRRKASTILTPCSHRSGRHVAPG
jgi:ACR3 family arsenite transporter